MPRYSMRHLSRLFRTIEGSGRLWRDSEAIIGQDNRGVCVAIWNSGNSTVPGRSGAAICKKHQWAFSRDFFWVWVSTQVEA